MDAIVTLLHGVASMEAVRLGFILARMNGLQVFVGDVGNPFLCGKTREKVFLTAGEEFGKDAGKRMIIDRSLHGLKSSSARFHEHLSVRLRQMGCKPSKSSPRFMASESWRSLRTCCTLR
jgi:hypothetical protein